MIAGERADLLVSNGIGRIDLIEAPEIAVRTALHSLEIDRLRGRDVDLRVDSPVGRLYVRDALLEGSSITARADTIDFDSVQHPGAGTLSFDLAGPGERLARQVDVLGASGGLIRFDSLEAVTADVRTTAGGLRFMETLIGNRATFSNGAYDVLVDNATLARVPGYDLQLRSRTPFYLYFQGASRPQTNAVPAGGRGGSTGTPPPPPPVTGADTFLVIGGTGTGATGAGAARLPFAGAMTLPAAGWGTVQVIPGRGSRDDAEEAAR